MGASGLANQFQYIQKSADTDVAGNEPAKNGKSAGHPGD